MSLRYWALSLSSVIAVAAGIVLAAEECRAMDRVSDRIVDRKTGNMTIPPVVRQHRTTLPAEHASVRFAPGDSTLTPDAVSSLDVQAETLRRLPNAPVWIYGYADPEEESLPLEASKLARRRAEAVRDYLLAQGALLKEHKIIVVVAERPNNPRLLSTVERPARYATTFLLPWSE
ncbi:OmpA family protein [Ferrovibrio terrae]|uniref:OmpA family protein n=1 Tax=Ferrovibrio terrae TaxID=2594003 RepID=UPI0031378F82